MGGLRVQTPPTPLCAPRCRNCVCLNTTPGWLPMRKLNLSVAAIVALSAPAGPMMSALADACSLVYFRYCPGFRTRGDVRQKIKRNLALVCWLGVRLRSRRVFGLASRYLCPSWTLGSSRNGINRLVDVPGWRRTGTGWLPHAFRGCGRSTIFVRGWTGLHL
jgi:hypothetical protein